ncbi:ImmA/IrrE family metallo-endopeptidase [Bradyrhizobium zhanjiangense]|uniref:ImmA/IrrE family metallo-endopeptidase n=1 Tax=Bradyrhizobium zhanjiangense TaxID=1325107 RepID=A0ABY0DAY4_9BRAD|nr:ImmA/IrrE family metallo-endopeptidase [Bradyrhizobium zhanjiangense]RXG87364.1 ImmA/IrrE family metallo-endopeptidase [Bradyrhizobium zhanjiangense]
MNIVPIRSEAIYETTLERIAALIGRSDQRSRDELEVLQALVEKWEREKHTIAPPTAVEAIRFRMQQGNLKPRDLEPYIGQRSRVSEVLGGRRALSIDMIRALHRHLGIPLSSLVGTDDDNEPRLAKTAMKKLESFGVMKLQEDLSAFLARAFAGNPSAAMLRKTRTERTNAKTDPHALEAWCAAVLLKAASFKPPKRRQAFAPELGRELARLSTRSDGPSLAKEVLARAGIAFVVLEHLPGTFLDGAAVCRADGAPVIALTLRHDRLDNFWFTLLHEYAHVCRHLVGDTKVIFDDLEVKPADMVEKEADEFAQTSLIPPEIAKGLASAELTPEDIVQIAADAEVHPAIVAGRWQREHNDYRRFAKMLGRGAVRTQLLRRT